MSVKRLLSHRKLLKTTLPVTIILRPEFPTRACCAFTRNRVVKDSHKRIHATVHILEYWTNTVPGQRNTSTVMMERNTHLRKGKKSAVCLK